MIPVSFFFFPARPRLLVKMCSNCRDMVAILSSNRFLHRIQELGARIARPGEFSERAFLNDKLDLAQAEAIADLIESGTDAAARAAQRSLQGEFSRRINELQASLTGMRVFVEAAIDFPDEEIDFLAESDVLQRLDDSSKQLMGLLRDARQGAASA